MHFSKIPHKKLLTKEGKDGKDEKMQDSMACIFIPRAYTRVFIVWMIVLVFFYFIIKDYLVTRITE